MKRQAYLAVVGDANDPVAYSGTPYYFLQAARSAGLLDAGLRLPADGWRWASRRYAWNLGRVLAGDRPGGYQYSVSFLEQLWRPVGHLIRSAVVMNCFQLFAPSVVGDESVEKWFFIDQTLQQLFDHYGDRSRIGERVASDALVREREGYHAAAGVIANSRWAARSLTDEYGVRSERVHVVPQAANVQDEEYRRWETDHTQRRATASAQAANRPMRLVFVGKDWKRKGLDRLLGALALARAEGYRGSLRVIGCLRDSLPASLRHLDGVEWHGFVDKRVDMLKLLHLIGECDFGCLLSRAEAGGIALREYHALGLVVLGTDAGGAPDQLIPEASVVVPRAATNQEIAQILLDLERDTARRAQLTRVAWDRRRSALWPESVRQILTFWPYRADLRTTAGGGKS